MSKLIFGGIVVLACLVAVFLLGYFIGTTVTPLNTTAMVDPQTLTTLMTAVVPHG